jgi:tetratricopeptide (TPR) repeat protein
MTQTFDIRQLDIHSLEETIEAYPWFAIAHARYFEKMASMGNEYARSAMKKVGLYLPDRRSIYNRVVLGIGPKPKEEKSEKSIEEVAPKPKYIVAGGDYFSKEDFAELDNSGESFSALRFTLKNNLSSSLDQAASILTKDYSSGIIDEEICTETLAHIYFAQGFYQRAIEIYNKLILYYPEKNLYFATLIEKCKRTIK